MVALFNLFVSRVRDQLHIVLAMSPIGDAFRNRLRKFPSLVNCCTIDWFQVRGERDIYIDGLGEKNESEGVEESKSGKVREKQRQGG